MGSGVSADVYVAEDIKLSRRVAVKRLRPALADDDKFLNLFRTEARVSAKVTHENVLSVYDWGEQDGLFLVSELLRGGTLKAVLSKTPKLEPAQAIEVARQAAAGIHAAHSRGLVHRDIKPANLLFDTNGRLRVADFGVARAVAESAWTELTGTFVGTVKYAAPEQMKRESGEVPIDSRADIYSLGLVLAEMLTGEVPLLGADAFKTIEMRRDTGVELEVEGLEELTTLVNDCCMLDSTRRPTALQLIERLTVAAPKFGQASPLPLQTLDIESHIPSKIDLQGDTTNPVSDVKQAPFRTTPDETPRRALAAKVAPFVAAASFVCLVGVLGYLAVNDNNGQAFNSTILQEPAAATVDDFVGRNLTEVRPSAEEQGLELEVDSVLTNDAEVGEVTSQSIDPGEEIEEGEELTVTVAQGPISGALPNVLGLGATSARQVLEREGFSVEATASVPSDDVPEGQVIAVFVGGDEVSIAQDVFEDGTAVELRVSSGPSLVAVPNVYGLSPARASEVLQAAGFGVATEERTTQAGVAIGQAFGSEPLGETVASGGSTVTILISEGPPVVPDVTGLAGTVARARLVALGLDVVLVGGPETNAVVQVNPTPGTALETVDRVTLLTALN